MDTVTVLLKKEQVIAIAQLMQGYPAVGGRKWYILGEAAARNSGRDLEVDFTTLDGVEELARKAGMVW